jgi:hypothetical protein
VQRGSGQPQRAVVLAAKWRRPPFGFTRWRDEWLFVDGTTTLHRFTSKGAALPPRRLPVAATDIVTAGHILWIYNSLPRHNGPRFWTSATADEFRPTAASIGDADIPPRERVLQTQLALVGAPNGDLLYAHLVGPPALTRVKVNGDAKRISLAYTRSARRAALVRVVSEATDPSMYSTPVRHVAVGANGDILVVRNREDVRDASGRIREEQGRRVDRYTTDGKHVGTAVLTVSTLWVLSEAPGAVVAITPDGMLVRGAFGKPIPGGVIN